MTPPGEPPTLPAEGTTVPEAVFAGTRPGPWPDTWRLREGPGPAVRSGRGSLTTIGTLAAALGFRRPLVTADRGIAAAGILDRALRPLAAAGLEAAAFTEFGENPTETEAASGAEAAARHDADSLIGLGGGSSLDMAKAVGFLRAGGGVMEDYRGYDRAPHPLPPLLGVPTTAGTGSEAQSYALISRDRDHRKMACGAPSAMFRAVLHDPTLLGSAPPEVAAAAGYDALAHSVETAVTTRADGASRALSRRAFALLAESFERVVSGSADLADRGRMQRGAFYAGAAIERSMLGAAHALANPLTRRYGVSHGRALARTLPPVARWNGRREAVSSEYAALLRAAGIEPGDSPGDTLAARLSEWAAVAALSGESASRDAARSPGAGNGTPPEADLPDLAAEAAEEWTGRFNPRPFDAEAALSLYRELR